MKIYETNAALGYGEVAYFIKVNEKEKLCIFSNECSDAFFASWIPGKCYNDLEDECCDLVIPEKHKMVLDQSPLSGTYLFNEFLKNLKD